MNERKKEIQLKKTSIITFVEINVSISWPTKVTTVY